MPDEQYDPGPNVSGDRLNMLCSYILSAACVALGLSFLTGLYYAIRG